MTDGVVSRFRNFATKMTGSNFQSFNGAVIGQNKSDIYKPIKIADPNAVHSPLNCCNSLDLNC